MKDVAVFLNITLNIPLIDIKYNKILPKGPFIPIKIKEKNI
jgi:hypothetical protein